MKDFIFSAPEEDNSPKTACYGKITHNFRRLPRNPQPAEPVELAITLSPRCPASQAWIYYTTDGSDPVGKLGKALNGQVIALQPAQVDWDTPEWGYTRCFRGLIPGQPADTVVRYRISARVNGHTELYADQGQYFAYYVGDTPLPDWTRYAVVYHIFLDRFSPGDGKAWKTPSRLDGFFGGTLQGIIDHLDYLQDLGINTLYLSPIFPSPSHHGYDATDYFEIEPRYGSIDDFRRLLDDAHARGMRLLLDFVPNHCSDLHAAFQEAISNPESPHREWYSFSHYPDDYTGFFGVKCMPQINLRNPVARKYMLDAARYWLEFGVDGFRIDYAIGPTPDFWADFRKAILSVRPDAWIIGEVVDTAVSQLAFHGLFSGCLDFLLLEAFRQTFAYRVWDLEQFASFLERHQAYFPADFSRPAFLDNHDVDRFIWAAKGDQRLLKIAALCQFTLSGPPIIYYGTEAGLSQQHGIRETEGAYGYLEEARLPMLWGEEQDHALHQFYRSLIQFRTTNSWLAAGDWELERVGPDVCLYTRSNRTNRLLVALNLSDSKQILNLEGIWLTLCLETSPGSSLTAGPENTCLDLAPMTGVVIR